VGLLTGSKNDAVSAMNVQANIKGSTRSRSRVTKVYAMGVNISAVASLERNMVVRVPRAKTPTYRRKPLPPEALAMRVAQRSKTPAWSASAAMVMRPRKKP
jgi:hypothetical protein